MNAWAAVSGAPTVLAKPRHTRRCAAAANANHQSTASSSSSSSSSNSGKPSSLAGGVPAQHSFATRQQRPQLGVNGAFNCGGTCTTRAMVLYTKGLEYARCAEHQGCINMQAPTTYAAASPCMPEPPGLHRLSRLACTCPACPQE
jgi:hypothetical protein